jgi:hypothetical protein
MSPERFVTYVSERSLFELLKTTWIFPRETPGKGQVISTTSRVIIEFDQEAGMNNAALELTTYPAAQARRNDR